MVSALLTWFGGDLGYLSPPRLAPLPPWPPLLGASSSKSWCWEEFQQWFSKSVPPGLVEVGIRFDQLCTAVSKGCREENEGVLRAEHCMHVHRKWMLQSLI